MIHLLNSVRKKYCKTSKFQVNSVELNPNKLRTEYKMNISPSYQPSLSVPLMTREVFAQAIGLPLGVFVSQCERGYWPQITVGKRVFINVEAVRAQAVQRGQEFVL